MYLLKRDYIMFTLFISIYAVKVDYIINIKGDYIIKAPFTSIFHSSSISEEGVSFCSTVY